MTQLLVLGFATYVTKIVSLLIRNRSAYSPLRLHLMESLGVSNFNRIWGIYKTRYIRLGSLMREHRKSSRCGFRGISQKILINIIILKFQEIFKKILRNIVCWIFQGMFEKIPRNIREEFFDMSKILICLVTSMGKIIVIKTNTRRKWIEKMNIWIFLHLIYYSFRK